MGGLPRAGLALGARPLPGDPLSGEVAFGVVVLLATIVLIVRNERFALILFRGDPERADRPLWLKVRAGLRERPDGFFTSDTFRLAVIRLWIFAFALALGYVGVTLIVDGV